MCELMQHSITVMYAHNINLIKIHNDYLWEMLLYQNHNLEMEIYRKNIHNEWRAMKARSRYAD